MTLVNIILAFEVGECCTGIILHHVSTPAMCSSMTSLRFTSFSSLPLVGNFGHTRPTECGAIWCYTNPILAACVCAFAAAAGLIRLVASTSKTCLVWMQGLVDVCLVTHVCALIRYLWNTLHPIILQHIHIVLQLSSDLSVCPSMLASR